MKRNVLYARQNYLCSLICGLFSFLRSVEVIVHPVDGIHTGERNPLIAYFQHFLSNPNHSKACGTAPVKKFIPLKLELLEQKYLSLTATVMFYIIFIIIITLIAIIELS